MKETNEILEEQNNEYGYYQQLIKDAIKDLREKGSTYVFSMSHVEEILRKVPDATYRKIENRLYLVRRRL